MLHIQKSRCLSSPTFNEPKCSVDNMQYNPHCFTADVDSIVEVWNNILLSSIVTNNITIYNINIAYHHGVH